MKIVPLIAIMMACTAASAQSRSYAAYLRPGVINIENSKTVLPAVVSNVSGFGSSYYGIGGEFEYKANRVVLAGEISIMAHGPVNTRQNYAEPFAGALMGKTGFVLFERKNVLFYPAAGAGLCGILLNTYTKTDGLKSSLHTVYLITPAVDLSFNGDVIVYRFRNESATGILPVGFRSGYRFSTQSDRWKKISGTNMKRQSFANSGWYFSIALGIGYYSSKKNK